MLHNGAKWYNFSPPRWSIIAPPLTDSRALRAPLARHHVQPGLLRVGEGVRQPDGDSRRDRQDRASLGHTRVRRAQLPDCRGAEPAGGGCVAPAKVIVARQKWLSRQLTSCRPCTSRHCRRQRRWEGSQRCTYAVRNQQSEKESKRQNLLTHPARMVDAVQARHCQPLSHMRFAFTTLQLEEVML